MTAILESKIQEIAKKFEEVSNSATRERTIELLSNISRNIIAKTGKSLEDVLKDAPKELKDLSKNVSRDISRFKELHNKRSKSNKTVNTLSNAAAASTEIASQSVTAFSRSLARDKFPISEFFNNLKGLPGIGIFMAGIGAGALVMEKFINNYTSLAQQGIIASGGILGAAQSAKELGLSFDEAAKIFKEHSNAVVFYGLENITGLVKNIRNTAPELAAFGMTSADVTSYSLKLLSANRMITDESGRDLMSREDSLRNQITDFYKVTRETGLTLEELMDGYLSATKDPMETLFYSLINPENIAEMEALKKKSPQLFEILKQTVLRGGNIAMIDPELLNQVYAGGAQADLQKMADSLYDPITSLRDFAAPLAIQSDEMRNMAELLSFRQQYAASALYAEFAMLDGKLVDGAGNLIATADDLTNAALKAQMQIMNAKSELEIAAIKAMADFTQNTNLFGEGGLTDTINSGLSAIEDFAKNGFDFPFTNQAIETTQNILDSITNKENIFDFLSVGAITAGIVGAVALYLGSPVFATMVGSVFGELGNKIGDIIDNFPLDLDDLKDIFDDVKNKVKDYVDKAKKKARRMIRRARVRAGRLAQQMGRLGQSSPLSAARSALGRAASAASSVGSSVAGVASRVPKGVGAGLIAAAAAEGVKYLAGEDSTAGIIADIFSSAGTGASIGGLGGAAVGGVGAIPGAILGGLAGLGYGIYDNAGKLFKSEEKPKEEKPKPPVTAGLEQPIPPRTTQQVQEQTQNAEIKRQLLAVLTEKNRELKRQMAIMQELIRNTENLGNLVQN